ncbi:uncharacterized protein MYCFIDRAFT_85064 [Pseudocercospora fijiensis CIRAD86]|uniref:N-acetylglucosamine-induced protein 1 n=1 Tax=Pseudocercospora fijiensis (strain CIRAD86) TaxID=383855 RepID=M3B2V3_PSEFD|nr:uncharacterized protein MYCFIDRAFT_85064 [Pseudocercospora fijiensis CIRAD86]EME83693.1 hypothetical protein MYCFIDRAFT_85064 [Pseudocercospora fijiensis CIRAD86]
MSLPTTNATGSDSRQHVQKFWNVNVPPNEHADECPEFLRYAFKDLKDQETLRTPDAAYRRQTWDEIQRFIRENRLELFQRLPSDLRLYREYCSKLIREYGSIMDFVLQERLEWEELSPSGPPFSNPADIKILYNDWPYGIDERIVHLVVWTKFELLSDPASEIGDMAPETRRLIQEFVDRTFGKDDVVWFRNWSSLKSVHAVEHFHVMLFNPDMDFVREMTNYDVPLAQKLRHAVQDS